jgi:hypothetical protein
MDILGGSWGFLVSWSQEFFSFGILTGGRLASGFATFRLRLFSASGYNSTYHVVSFYFAFLGLGDLHGFLALGSLAFWPPGSRASSPSTFSLMADGLMRLLALVFASR